MDDFPGYDMYLVHFYAHSPDYNDPDCGYCDISSWDVYAKLFCPST